MADTGRIFTAKEMSEAAQAASETWDWSAMRDEGKSPKYIAAYREALDFGDDPIKYANEVFCDDGEFDLDSAFGDIWDYLDEFAKSTAANIR